VLRGGAFNNNQRNVRCAYRNRNNPNNRNDNIGFRVVVAHDFLPAGTARRRVAARGDRASGPRPEKRRGPSLAEAGAYWRRIGRIATAPPPGPVPEAGHPLGASVYAQICSWDNLLLAHRRASRGKRGKAAAATFEHRLEDNLVVLQQELQTRTYRPGHYSSFHIHEPKRRLISAAPFRDRVVHHALCNVIEPVFERSFIYDSYANRAGKGTHRALDRAQVFARRHRYVLACDVRQFFPSIDHTILRRILARKLADPGVLWLLDRILDSGVGVLGGEYRMVWFPGDDLFAASRPRGLPIGNLTSQFWANCYLNPFDHFVKRELRCSSYLRYVDDLLLFAGHKDTLWAWLDALTERLARLRLTLHAGAQPRPVAEGIPFLGFTIFPHRRRLKRRKGIHYRRRFRRLAQRYAAGEISLETLTASARGWANHVRYGNTVGLRQAVLETVVLSSQRH
jgi:retron-type reverse transcriptase